MNTVQPKQLGLAVIFFMLSACASTPKLDSTFSKDSRAHLYKMQKWQMQGRLAIIAADDSWSANIEWAHLPSLETIKLSGPLGQGAVMIELADGAVKIDRGGGNVQTSNQPEQFISQQLGLSVPIQSLRFWAVGLPEAGQPYQETADGFVQDGWLITYKAMQNINAESMPHKMAVSNDQVKLKLIVDRWGLNGEQLN